MTKKYKISHKIAAAMTMGAMVGASRSALAQGGATDFVDLTNNMISASGGIQNLIALVGYLGGSGLAVSGIFKLKSHVDNPSNTPLKEGLVRLGAGGALLSLPFMITAMQGSISDGANEAFTAQTLQAFEAQ